VRAPGAMAAMMMMKIMIMDVVGSVDVYSGLRKKIL
jgi:hypothetical protein